MTIAIGAEGEATFPEGILEQLGAEPGDELELEEHPDGYLLRLRSGTKWARSLRGEALPGSPQEPDVG